MAMTTQRDIHDRNDEPIDAATAAQLRQQLLADRRRLQEELRRENEARAAGEDAGDFVHAMPDPGDASVASEQADLRHAQIGRDAAELRQIEAALERIDDGSYGTCTVCGLDIAAARLRATPTAERCIVCQSAFERQYADTGTPTITRKV